MQPPSEFSTRSTTRLEIQSSTLNWSQLGYALLAAFLAPGTPLYATCSSCYCVAAAVAEPTRATDEPMGSMSKPVQTRLTHLNHQSKPN